MNSSPRDLDLPEYSGRRLIFMMKNAARWRCPTCGQRPMFVPWRQVKNLRDWFMPLDGCPVCGYAFEREPGYFLLSIFAVNYLAGAFIGLLVYLLLEFVVRLPIWPVLILSIIPIPIFNFWFARHSKSFFLAFDLFFDPHRRSDGGGDQPVPVRDPAPSKPPLKPVR